MKCWWMNRIYKREGGRGKGSRSWNRPQPASDFIFLGDSSYSRTGLISAYLPFLPCIAFHLIVISFCFVSFIIIIYFPLSFFISFSFLFFHSFFFASFYINFLLGFLLFLYFFLPCFFSFLFRRYIFTSNSNQGNSIVLCIETLIRFTYKYLIEVP